MIKVTKDHLPKLKKMLQVGYSMLRSTTFHTNCHVIARWPLRQRTVDGRRMGGGRLSRAEEERQKFFCRTQYKRILGGNGTEERCRKRRKDCKMTVSGTQSGRTVKGEGEFDGKFEAFSKIKNAIMKV